MKYLVPLIVVVVAVIVSISITSTNKKEARMESYDNATMDSMEKETDVIMMEDKDGDAMMESHGDNMMDSDPKAMDSMEKDETAMMKKAGSFVNYEDVDVASLSGKIVLDFSATWCPSCRTFKADVAASLDDIPENLNLVVVDYDTYTDLRKKYNVTYQHTFVQIDRDGNEIKKWSGGSTLESVIQQVS